MKRAAWALAAALLSSSCAQGLMKLPEGPGVAAADWPGALAEATASCRNVQTFTAEIAASGSVGGRRIRARLLVGLARPAAVRLEAVAAFGPLFVFAARDTDATLLLPHDNRALVHGDPAQVLEAVTGLPLDGRQMLALVTGCADAGRPWIARRFGEDWIVGADGTTDVYLHRAEPRAPWRVVAAVHHESPARMWRADYQDVQDGLPRRLRVTGLASRRIDLGLALSQVDVNQPLDGSAFVVPVPSSAVPIELSELEDSGPLGGSTTHVR